MPKFIKTACNRWHVQRLDDDKAESAVGSDARAPRHLRAPHVTHYPRKFCPTAGLIYLERVGAGAPW